MPLLPKSNYYDAYERQAASLIRARQPYLVRNILTGLSLCAATVGIYAYTLKAIGVDEFEDVKPAQQPHAPNAGAGT